MNARISNALLSVLTLSLSSVAIGCRTGKTCCTQAPAPLPAAVTNSSSAQKVFQVQGVVREIKEGGKIARIKHEEIPGYMAAMTMPFDVKDPQEVAGVQPGDKVSFRMTVTDTDGWIDQIRVLEKGVPEEAKPEIPGVRIVRQVEELDEGGVLPDYPLVTESKRPIRLSDFKGRALGFSFIYTRCPYPTFCPRQNRQFAEAVEQLKQRLPGPDPRWHLLSISFDPAYDTPAVLYRYAKQFGFEPEWWNFCTGEMIEIDAITEQFGMFFARDGQGFSHNVRTVVVDPSGRIQRIFIGNDWTVEEFVAEMVKAAGS